MRASSRDFDLTQDAAAQRVGKAGPRSPTRSACSPSRRRSRVTSARACERRARQGAARRREFPRAAGAGRRTLEQGLSVRGLEELLKHKSGGTGKKRRMPGATAAALTDIEKKLTTHLGARSTLKHSPKRGRIIIEYQGNEDLSACSKRWG